MICPSCGVEVEDGFLFCSACGAQITSALTQNGVQPEAQPVTQPEGQLTAEPGQQYQQPGQQYQQPGQQYQQPGQQYQQPYMTPAGSKSKIAAGLFALFLGDLGVHKFYLGYKKEGGILLGVFILGLLLSFVGVGLIVLFVEAIIVFIEGIIYLTKSDQEFEAIYVQGYKPWF